MTYLKLIALVVLVALAALTVFIRFAPSNPARWHVDPLTAMRPDTPNSFLMLPRSGKYPSPEFAQDAQTLARAFDAHVLSQRNTKRLAGMPGDLFVTYITRTRLMGYPDYVSVRFVPLENGTSSIAVFSRSRFGHGDKGVNRTRFLGWLKTFPG